MSDDLNKRLATLNALLELKEAVALDDFQSAQDCRDKRLILALDLFSTHRKRHDALQQVFDVTGRWVRGLGSANTVVEALKRAIPLFEIPGDHGIGSRARIQSMAVKREEEEDWGKAKWR